MAAFVAYKPLTTIKSISYARADINPCHATALFLYPVKTSESQRFSDIFREHRKRPVAWKKNLELLYCYISKNRYNNLCNVWAAVYGFCYRSCTFHWIIKIEITCCWAQILGGFSTFAGLPMFNKNTQCLVLLNFMVPHLHLEVNKYEEADVGTNFAGLLKKQWI